MDNCDTYALNVLEGLCAIYSPSYGEREAVEFMVGKAAEAGMRTARIDEVGNFVAERGDGDRTLLFLGHIDTVKGFIPTRIEDGRLYGRGAVDAKGPLAAAFVAASQVRDLQNLRLVVVGAVEEEAPTSTGARHILKTYRPDFVIIGEPSGAAGITVGYKGRVNLRYVASRPHEHTAAAGRSVAAHAVDVWNEIEAYCRQFNQDKGVFDTLDPHLAELNTATDGMADTVDLRASVRLPLDFAVPAFEQALRGMVADSTTLTLDGLVEAFKATKRNALIRALLQAIRAEGLEPTFKVKTGTSDMNLVGPVWNCPIVAYGPGDSKLDHTPHEHVRVDEYLAAVRVLVKVIEQISASLS